MANAEDYKEIARELNVLRDDLARSATASKFTASANKSAIDEQKARLGRLEERLRVLEAIGPKTDHRLVQLEDRDKEHTGKIRTFEINGAKDEKDVEIKKVQADIFKSKWAFYGIVASAVAPGLIALILQLLGLRS